MGTELLAGVMGGELRVLKRSGEKITFGVKMFWVTKGLKIEFSWDHSSLG